MPGAAPAQPVERVAAAAAIADDLDDERGIGPVMLRRQQPGPDRVAAISGNVTSYTPACPICGSASVNAGSPGAAFAAASCPAQNWSKSVGSATSGDSRAGRRADDQRARELFSP
jgi:hypothetical protein